MAVKIRLQRKGRKKAPFYHIVIADARSPRDGKYIERIGSYNPMTKPATIEIDRDAAFNWLSNGAQPTETVLAILRFKGVMMKKHLQRGVTKGAMTQEQADAKWQEWNTAKEEQILNRRKGTQEEVLAKRKAISGQTKAKPVPVDSPVEENIPEVTEEAVSADALVTNDINPMHPSEPSIPAEMPQQQPAREIPVIEKQPEIIPGKDNEEIPANIPAEEKPITEKPAEEFPEKEVPVEIPLEKPDTGVPTENPDTEVPEEQPEKELPAENPEVETVVVNTTETEGDASETGSTETENKG